MVDRAEGESVAHDWLARLLRVADDVRGVEEPDLPESADRAAILRTREAPRRGTAPGGSAA